MAQVTQPDPLCDHCLAPIPAMRSRHLRGLQRYCSGACVREAEEVRRRLAELAVEMLDESDHWKGG